MHVCSDVENKLHFGFLSIFSPPIYSLLCVSMYVRTVHVVHVYCCYSVFDSLIHGLVQKDF